MVVNGLWYSHDGSDLVSNGFSLCSLEWHKVNVFKSLARAA